MDSQPPKLNQNGSNSPEKNPGGKTYKPVYLFLSSRTHTYTHTHTSTATIERGEAEAIQVNGGPEGGGTATIEEEEEEEEEEEKRRRRTRRRRGGRRRRSGRLKSENHSQRFGNKSTQIQTPMQLQIYGE